MSDGPAQLENPAVAAQIAAAAPDRSSWVAANAGSGKTRVLTNRVARLLLAGTDPQRILCLTYTKAAAAEMQTRLFRTLGTWAMLDDDALRGELSQLGSDEGALPVAELARARTLFARALETPGGLKIQTIHAFCEALLRRFPVEAGVAPQFTVLEDRHARALREEVLDAIAEAEPELVAELARYLSGDDPDPLLCEIGRNRAAFAGDFDPARLAAALGADPADTAETLCARTIGESDLADLRALLPLLASSGKNDQRAGETLAAALAGGPTAELLPALEGVLLTGATAKAPFTAKAGSFPAKALRLAHPVLCDRIGALMARIEAARVRRIGLLAFGRSSALGRFARVWLREIEARKAALGLLDFDDMIDRSRLLLSNPATAAWVLWRLDGGLDHVLVDEAQDTSPAQWQVVRAITDEFFAGVGARDVTRTVFVVGDEKQSIYSFQGADPAAFGEMRMHFAGRLEAMGAALQRCGLIHSFRSAGPVLEVVDAVFAGPAGEGLENTVAHQPFRAEKPGRVEIWPFLPKPEKSEEPPWYEPVDARGPDDPTERLAARIADRIADLLATGQELPGSTPPRPIMARDVMILVQRRNPLFHAVIRALKRADVPVAGADVLRIGAELAVKDLLACLRVATTPADDLSLAALLRSPLGGISEETLFALAHGRKSLLRAALRESTAPELAPARALVADLLGQADFLRPYELLQRILIRHDGRRKLVARLGSEAEDGIDALLDQALAYERGEPPGLTGFLAWIDRDEMQVKRRAEDSADQVRVMTVHGAKGIEAPIVILPDTVERQEGRNAPEILAPENGPALWKMRTEDAPETMRDAEEARRARARAENMRLLYVALTRAESWLIVCGAGAEPKPDGNSWYALSRAALETLSPERIAAPDGSGETLVLSRNWQTGVLPTEAKTRHLPSLPAWARRPAPDHPGAAPPPLSPSSLGGAHALPPRPPFLEDEDDAAAKARGDAVHLLLETLPWSLPAEWDRLGPQLLAPDHGEAGPLLAEARAILEAPELGFIFAPDTLAEVEIAAPLPGKSGQRLQGRIDRLVVEPERILAVDFKSNRLAPDTPEQTPEGILRQLGAYHMALSEIWPGRRIETAIVWTRTAAFMPVPEALAKAAFRRALAEPLSVRDKTPA